MANLAGVYKEDTQNWFAACLAIRYCRDGLLDLVATVGQHLQTQVIQNAIASSNLPPGTVCVSCPTSVLGVIPCPTRGVCKKDVNRKCMFHTTPQRLCPNNLCNSMVQEIKSCHRFHCPSWQNTYAEQWSSNPFEILKCFMPKERYIDKQSAESTDFNGLINVVINCKLFENYFCSDLKQVTNICTEARAVTRDLRHNAGFRLDRVKLHKVYDALLALLNDPKFLFNDPKAQDASKEISELKAGKLRVTVVDIEEVLEDMRDCREKYIKQMTEDVAMELTYVTDEKVKEAEEKISHTTDEKVKEAKGRISHTTANNIKEAEWTNGKVKEMEEDMSSKEKCLSTNTSRKVLTNKTSELLSSKGVQDKNVSVTSIHNEKCPNIHVLHISNDIKEAGAFSDSDIVLMSRYNDDFPNYRSNKENWLNDVQTFCDAFCGFPIYCDDTRVVAFLKVRAFPFKRIHQQTDTGDDLVTALLKHKEIIVHRHFGQEFIWKKNANTTVTFKHILKGIRQFSDQAKRVNAESFENSLKPLRVAHRARNLFGRSREQIMRKVQLPSSDAGIRESTDEPQNISNPVIAQEMSITNEHDSALVLNSGSAWSGPHPGHFNQGTNGYHIAAQQSQARYPAFSDISERELSFRRWGRTLPSVKDLVRAGFFFTEQFDLVRCYYCGIGLKDFSDYDDPMMEHVKHSEDCKYLLQLHGFRQLQELKERVLKNDPILNRQRQRDLLDINPTTLNGLARFRARHPEYSSFESRLQTFTMWPSHLRQKPEMLASAGLFYTGVDDQTRCFACDGGLRRWDPEDEPWIEHCRWFPACPHCIQEKGIDFIQMVQASADEEASGTSSGYSGLESHMSNMALQTPEFQRLVQEHRQTFVEEMLFSEELFSTAIEELKQQGNFRPNTEDILIAIDVVTKRKAQKEDRRLPDMNGHTNTTEAMIEENQRLKDALYCSTCKTNTVNALFLPCTHHKMCMTCARDVTECPFCGGRINQIIKTFMA